MPLCLIKGKIIGTVDRDEFDTWLLKVKLLGFCKNLETREQIKKRNKNKYLAYTYGLYVDVDQLVYIIISHFVLAFACFMCSFLFRPCIFLLFVVIVSFVLMLIFICIDVKSYEVIDRDENKN